MQVRVGSHYANREAAARAHDRAQLAVKGRCADLLNYPLEEYASQVRSFPPGCSLSNLEVLCELCAANLGRSSWWLFAMMTAFVMKELIVLRRAEPIGIISKGCMP